jgi:F-type H+-transporting ATPase subunit epsilon
MSDAVLVLEVVTPDGLVLREEGLDVVVLHRRERRFDVGSEVAIFPRHGPLLVRLPVGPARYSRNGRTEHLALAGGFAEVLDNRVRLITPRCGRVAAEEPKPAEAAGRIARGWQVPDLSDVFAGQ